MRHEVKLLVRNEKTGRETWRCSCGHEFRSEDDAEEHAANAREEQRARSKR